MTRDEVLAKIAFDFSERYKLKGDSPDQARDWAQAERVFLHFISPPDTEDPLWRATNDRYNQYAAVMQDYLDSLPRD
jgi:hypothetical protein